MGEITDRFVSTFRDHIISGIPGSGAHEPVKSDIRALAVPIEAGIAAAALSGTDLDKAKDLVAPLLTSAQQAQANAEGAQRVASRSADNAEASANSARASQASLQDALKAIPASVSEQLAGAVKSATDIASQAADRSKQNGDAAQAAATRSAQSAATAESVAGPTYATQAAGEAATPTGQFFAVGNGDGTVTIRLRTDNGSVFQRRLATSDALSSPLPGGGLDLIGRPTVAALIASAAPSRGVGSLWYADDFVYEETTPTAADFDLATAGGVRLKVKPDASGTNPLSVGAVGDGTADDSGVLQFLASVKPSVTLPKLSFKARDISLRAGQRWDGNGAKLTVPAANYSVFAVPDGAHDWSISNLQLFGTLGENEVVPDLNAESESGMQVRNAQRGVVSNVAFNNFRKVGLYRNGVNFSNDRGLGRGCRTLGSNLGFYNCSVGLKTEQQATNEFDVFCNLHAGGCGIGVDLTAGNTIIVGAQLVDNDINLRLRGGNNNHAHGIISAVAINHIAPDGSYLAHFTDITNGHTLNAIHAYANDVGGVGNIFYERSAGINWAGGILDAWTYVKQVGFDATAAYPYNRQEGLFLPGGYGPARIFGRRADDSTWDDYSPYMIRRGCYGPGVLDQVGVTTNDPADVYVVVEQNGAGVPFSSGSYLRFPNVNRIGDRRRCYNPATGLITIPKWMSGLYEIGGNFLVGGVLSDVLNSFFEVVVQYSGGGERSISPPILPQPFADNGNLWTVNLGVIAKHISEGDRIGIRATDIRGSAPALGNPSWDSQWWLKKIA